MIHALVEVVASTKSAVRDSVLGAGRRCSPCPVESRWVSSRLGLCGKQESQDLDYEEIRILKSRRNDEAAEPRKGDCVTGEDS